MTFTNCRTILSGLLNNANVGMARACHDTADYKNAIKYLKPGEKPYAELPKYLKEFDVCLIPFGRPVSMSPPSLGRENFFIATCVK